MKTLRHLCVVLGITAACTLRADVAPAAPRTDVIFDHPEKYADIRDRDVPTEKGKAEILKNISDHLVQQTASAIPEGYKLTITFTDVRLAGDFEPWHGPQCDEIRIIKDIYPPEFKFTYLVTDPSGNVVRKGSEDIRDINFLTRPLSDPRDSLGYEKDILDEWAHSSLRKLKKA